MTDTAYEIYGRGFGWNWRFRYQETVVAHGANHHDESGGARADVDRVRAAAAALRDDTAAFAETEVRDPSVEIERDPTPDGTFPPERDNWVWRIETTDAVLAHSADRFPTADDARTAVEDFLEHAAGGIPTFMTGAEYEWRTPPPSVEVGTSGSVGLFRELLRGSRHRDALDRFDSRIVVTGSRGKSTTTRRLTDVLHRRGYDTLAKITGDRPLVIVNGEERLLDRQGPRTLLYENAQIVREYAAELDAYEPEDVAIFENQGLTPYTTGLVNRTFIDGDVVVVTNIRQDHVSTMGDSRANIARGIARAVPADAHVVVAEQHETLRRYLREEAERRGATVEFVAVPDHHRGLLGAETMHAINPALEAIDEPPLPAAEIDSYLAELQPEWTRLPDGRVYNAASVNDVESTEQVRRALIEDDEKILPFLYLREDRRGRTASFADYVELLADNDSIDQVHAAGGYATTLKRNVNVDVTVHDEDAGDVLDALLDVGQPVVFMGNTVADFMRQMEGAIAERLEVRKTTELQRPEYQRETDEIRSVDDG